jgi:hypothetical protein
MNTWALSVFCDASGQVYVIEVGQSSYGRCRKRWEEFEELYDALEMRHGEKLKELDFPAYITRYIFYYSVASSYDATHGQIFSIITTIFVRKSSQFLAWGHSAT